MTDSTPPIEDPIVRAHRRILAHIEIAMNDVCDAIDEIAHGANMSPNETAAFIRGQRYTELAAWYVQWDKDGAPR